MTTLFKLESEDFHFKEEPIHDKVECELTSLSSGRRLTWHHPPYPFSVAHPRFHPLAYLLYDSLRESSQDEVKLKLACEGIGLGFQFQSDLNPRMKARTDELVATYQNRPELSGWTFERLGHRYWVSAPGCLEDYLPFESLQTLIPFLAASTYSKPIDLRLEVLANYWKAPLLNVMLYAQKVQEVVVQRPRHLQPLNLHEKMWLTTILEGQELTSQLKRGFMTLTS